MSLKTINYVFSLFLNYSNWLEILYDRFFNINTKKVVLRNGLVISGGDSSQIVGIVNEIFVHKVYNPENFEIKKDDVVVDIGANIGVFSLYAAACGAKEIFSVEPLKRNIEIIRKNFINNNFFLRRIINIAISDHNGNSKFYLSKYDSHGMLFDRNNNGPTIKCVSVNTLTFFTFLTKYKIKKIDFLKIDCEGGEGFIFNNTNKKKWEKISKIAIEYHNNVSILDNITIAKKLVYFGFKVKVVESDRLYGYIYAWR
jgi:FkbM family methyltransferase